jgi:hypothetical protein
MGRPFSPTNLARIMSQPPIGPRLPGLLVVVTRLLSPGLNATIPAAVNFVFILSAMLGPPASANALGSSTA